MEDYTRDPCPWRIVDDFGGAFTIGAVGGALFHGVSGFRNAAKNKRMESMMRRIKMKSPILGGQFAQWGFCFSTIDCGCIYLRGKEDPLNSIFSGAATGFILAIRNGPLAAIGSGIVGGILLGMIEGMGILFTWYSADTFNPANRMVEDPSQMPDVDPTNASVSSISGFMNGGYQ